MLDDLNYVLQRRSKNRSEGAKMRERYLNPDEFVAMPRED